MMEPENSGKAKTKLITFKVLVMFTLLILVLSLFAFITHEVVFEKEDILDTAVTSFLQPYYNNNTKALMQFFSFFGSTGFLLPAYILIIGWMYKTGKRWYALNVLIISLGSFLLVKSLKLVFRRDRPGESLIENLQSYSFPSGHTVSAIVFFSLLIYVVWKTNLRKAFKVIVTIGAVITALMVGVSRIMLGVHYPSDVIAGVALASAWVMLSSWLLGKIKGSGVRAESNVA